MSADSADAEQTGTPSNDIDEIILYFLICIGVLSFLLLCIIFWLIRRIFCSNVPMPQFDVKHSISNTETLTRRTSTKRKTSKAETPTSKSQLQVLGKSKKNWRSQVQSQMKLSQVEPELEDLTEETSSKQAITSPKKLLRLGWVKLDPKTLLHMSLNEPSEGDLGVDEFQKLTDQANQVKEKRRKGGTSGTQDQSKMRTPESEALRYTKKKKPAQSKRRSKKGV